MTESDVLFRIRYQTAPGVPHVYMRVFTATNGGTFYASCGNLTMRRNDFAAFRKLFEKAEVEFVEEQKS